MPLLQRRGGDRYIPEYLGMKIILYDLLKNMGFRIQPTPDRRDGVPIFFEALFRDLFWELF
jgi:hypothetical protein